MISMQHTKPVRFYSVTQKKNANISHGIRGKNGLIKCYTISLSKVNLKYTQMPFLL